MVVVVVVMARVHGVDVLRAVACIVAARATILSIVVNISLTTGARMEGISHMDVLRSEGELWLGAAHKGAAACRGARLQHL